MAEEKGHAVLPLDDDPFDDVTHWIGRMKKDEDVPTDGHTRSKGQRDDGQSEN